MTVWWPAGFWSLWEAARTKGVNSAVIAFWMLALGAGLVWATWTFTSRLSPETTRSAASGWLRTWSIKGLAVPTAIWTLINFGLAWWLQPFMPQIQAAQNTGGSWFPIYLRVLADGWFIISSWWAALTLGWVVIQVSLDLRPEERADFRGLCLFSVLCMTVVAAAIVYFGGWPLVGLASFGILAPMAGYAPAIICPKKTPPMYARAIAKMKFGKYSEAEWEIIQQLENAEDDFEGWMMMAELYATHFRDLGEAQQTILDICNHPKVTPSQYAVALHRLADWQLKLAQNPERARSALQMICDRFPGSHLARMALLRMRQLPVTAAALRDQQTALPIPLPALGDHFDQETSESAADRSAAVTVANACVSRLRQDPNDVPARERLARTLSEHLGQADQGIAQLVLLLEMPDQPPSHRVEWMSLAAAWQLKYRHDVEAGRKWLERVVREFPDTPQALAANRRLHLLRTSVLPNYTTSQPGR